MYQIRFHGRGGQGMKTASRILGTAFFVEGYEVQDAPRYGAERRGAPLFAYVRAAWKRIDQRGIIQYPDLVIVADDTLVSIPGAGVLAGVGKQTVLLINSFELPGIWKKRLNFPGLLIVLPATEALEDRAELRYTGAACAGAAARLIGLRRESVERAVHEELAEAGVSTIQHDLDRTLEAYDLMADYAGVVKQSETPPADSYPPPAWIELPFEEAAMAAPDIHGVATSVQVKTGLWRTMRPVIDYDRCHRCWMCSAFCPDGAIAVSDGTPHIDYDHCKGCLICVAQCPYHAMLALAEHMAIAGETP